MENLNKNLIKVLLRFLLRYILRDLLVRFLLKSYEFTKSHGLSRSYDLTRPCYDLTKRHTYALWTYF